MIPAPARRRALTAVDGVLQVALGAGMVAMACTFSQVVLFGFAGLWFAARSLAGRRGHDAHHALMAAAMVRMLSPGSASTPVAVLLTLVFAVSGAFWLGRAGAFRPRALSNRMTQTPDDGERPMNLPRIVSRDEWLTVRKELLEEEKEVTLRRDALSARRRELPMVKVDKDYLFEGADGKAEPARPVRGPPPAHRLPLHVRPGRTPGPQELLAAGGQHRRTSRTCTPATRRSRSCPARRSAG